MRIAIRTLVAAIFITFVAVSMATAQEARTNTKMRGGWGYFMSGANILDLDGLNAKLRSTGHPTFSDNLFSLGAGGHAVINRFIIGGEGHGLLTSDKDFSLANRNYKTSLEAGYAFLNIGYKVMANGDFSLYPLIGIGGGEVTLRIRERTSASFDEILANPGRNATLTTGGLIIHASVGIDYLFVTKQDASRRRGILFGLRAGYNFVPIQGDWRLDEFEIAGGPEIDVTGPYVRLLIGGGGMRRQ